MKSDVKATILCSCLLFLSFCSGFVMTSASYSSPAVKGAYWPSWRNSDFPPSAIDSTLFTHVYYSFLAPSVDTCKFDIDSSTAPILLNFTSTLHAKNPPVKALYSIGGCNADPAFYARMASKASSRKAFILSSIEVARKYGFDGIDLAWQFPRYPKEMDYFSHLLDNWRAEVKKEAKGTCRPQILLTAAVYFANSFFLDSTVRSYPVASINKNLDWINAMCYDYAGSWDTSATGAHAALYDPTSDISTSYGLGSWIKAGILKSKLVMGLPLYGKTWTLQDASINGIGAPAVDVGPSGEGGKGILLYYEVEDYISKHNATVVFDLRTISTYAIDGKTWIGYDDSRSIARKIEYAQALGICGYFFWALSYDRNWNISKTASEWWRVDKSGITMQLSSVIDWKKLANM